MTETDPAVWQLSADRGGDPSAGCVRKRANQNQKNRKCGEGGCAAAP